MAEDIAKTSFEAALTAGATTIIKERTAAEGTPPATPPATPSADTLPATPPPTTPPATPTPTKSFEEYIAEKTEGKFKAWEDIDAVIKKASEPKEPEFQNEWLKNAYEYTEKKGGDLKEFLKIQTTDWDKVEATQLVKDQLAKENPKLDAEKLEKLFNHTYKLSEDADPSEQEIGKIKITSEAEKIREKLKAEQIQNLEPKGFKERQEAEQKAKDEAKRIADLKAENQRVWEKAVAETIKDPKITHVVKTEDGREVAVEHVLDETETKQMREILNNPNTIFNNYKTEDGNVDMVRFKRDMFMLKNMDKMLARAAENGIADFIKKDLKNANFKDIVKVPGSKTDLKAAAEKVLIANM